MKRIPLYDGIHLNIIPSDKFKTNYFDFNMIVPLRSETASLNALFPSVLKRGSQQYPSISALNQKLDELYSTTLSARVFKRGEAQIVGFTTDFLKNSFLPEKTDLLEEALSVIEDIVYRPLTEKDAFRADYTESEKTNLIDSINAQMNNKNAYAMQKCVSIMCQQEAYGTTELGTVADVNNITPVTLYSHYKEVLEQAQIELFFTGECEEEQLTKQLLKLFAGKKRTKVLPCETQIIKTVDTIKEVTEEMPVNQGKLSLGFRTGFTLKDKNYAYFSLFNELYGGSPTSKLFENVREKLSLCYYCRSIPEAHKGVLIVASGIEVQNRELAQKEILAQLETVKKGDFSEEEIVSAKKSVVNSYRELYDDARALSSWYLSRVIVEDYSSPEDTVSTVLAASATDIKDASQNIILDTVYFLKGTLEGKGEEE
jgi:Predicted Zn-dependent peptidases